MIVRFFFSARRVGREIRKHQECMTDKCRTENVLRASMPECESGSLRDWRATQIPTSLDQNRFEEMKKKNIANVLGKT